MAGDDPFIDELGDNLLCFLPPMVRDLAGRGNLEGFLSSRGEVYLHGTPIHGFFRTVVIEEVQVFRDKFVP